MVLQNSSIDAENFIKFFDEDFRLVKEHEFRKSIFRNGIKEDFRNVVWKFLFQFYQFNSTKRERLITKREKQIEYTIMKVRWNKIYDLIKDSNTENYDQFRIPPLDFGMKIDLNQDKFRDDLPNTDFIEENQDVNLDSIKIQTILKISRINPSISKLVRDIRLIEKDVERTSYLCEIRNDKNNENENVDKTANSLRNILITFAAFNQNLNDINDQSNFNLGYTQGMNELASVFISVFNEESIAYWCFSNFMLLDTYSNSSMTLNTTQIADTHVLKTNVAYYFSDVGITKKLKHLSFLLSITDEELYTQLVKIGLDGLNFCHEWLILCFKRCFKTTREFQRCFEIISSRFIEFNDSALKNICVKNLYTFDLFICLSLLKQFRVKFLEKDCDSDIEFFEKFSQFNKSKYFSDNFDFILNDAEEIFNKYCIISHSRMTDEDNESGSKTNGVIQKLKEYIFN